MRRWSFRLSLLLAVILVSGSFPSLVKASPIIYYVAKNGNDSWNGTAADYVSGTTGPFLTIQKCASVAVSGDTCMIRSGTYRETVKPANSGTSAAKITFQPYQNESVTINGADQITSVWTPKNGSAGVFQTQISLNPALFANQIFVDGKMMTQARWPNTSGILLYPTLATAEVNSGATGTVSETVYDAHLPNIDLTGSKVWIMGGAQFTAHSGTISASAPGQFTFNQPINGCASLCAKQGSRYFLYGSLAFLDAPSEWHYDNSSQTLYLQTPDNSDPSAHIVEVKQRNYAFDLAGRSYIQVQGISMFAATIFTDSTSTYNLIDGINVQYPSHYIDIPDNQSGGPYTAHNSDTGVIFNGTYNTLKNSTIAYSAGNGVAQIGRYNVITNNLIHDTDYAGTYNAPIYVGGNGSDVTVTYNTLYNTGRDGMTGGHMRNRIAYNNVYNFGLLAKDLGGYYTCCGTTLGTGTSIDHNWFHDDQSGGGVGIYIDNGASQFLIHHNASWNNNGYGALLNGFTTGNSQGNHVYNNTFGGGQLKSIGSGGVTNSVYTEIKNNIFRGPTDPIPGGSIWSNNLSASTDPLFVDEASKNYHLQSGSPAIDAGAVIPGITDGYSGSAPDQGAYEFSQYDWFPGCNFNGYGSSCSQTNMLENPGFEQGTLSWIAAGGSIMTSSDAHSGVSSLKVYNRTGASNSARQSLVIENGKTYTFSAWTKLGSGTDSAYLVLEIVTGGQKVWKQLASSQVNSTSWTQLSRTFTFNEAGPITSANLYVQTGTSLADLYVDDMFADVFKTRLTAPGMYVDKTKLNDAISTAQTLYNSSVEGSAPGQYPAGSKAELLAAIQAAQTVANDPAATQDQVDSATRTLNNEITAFRNSRNLDPTIYIDIRSLLSDQAGWDAEAGTLDFTDGNLTFSPKSSRTVAGYSKRKIPHNAILQFKTKLDTSNGLEGFALRAANTNLPAWSSNNQYLIVVKSSKIEVQKWNGNQQIVQVIPNTFLSSGTWHTVQFGAIDTHGGVQIILNVDGTPVVNWTDTNNPLQDEGYFEIYGSSSHLPIMLGSIDATPPVTTAIVSPEQPDGLNGWYIHPVTVTLSATDDASGVAKTVYSLDNGNTWQVYASPVTLNSNGMYVLSYRSSDNAGNEEALKTVSLNLDSTSPAIAVSIPGESGIYDDSGDLTPLFTVNDNLSGVDNSKTTATLDAASYPFGTTTPLYTLPLGPHIFTVTAGDLAGNQGTRAVHFQTVTSLNSLKELVTLFTKNNRIDNAGIVNSLQAKLANNNLNSFVNEVQAQSGKHISSDAATYLLRDAQFLLSQH